LPPDTKCLITQYKPNVATDGNGNAQHEIVYATTADASAVPPGIKHVSTLKRGEGRDQFTILESNIEKTNLTTTFEDGKGTIYNYMYSVKFWLPVDSRGFFIVYLDADAADGEGMTFDIVGGVTGGYTGDIVVGSDTLKYKGGLLMEIKSND
jgi:hypothetical protein